MIVALHGIRQSLISLKTENSQQVKAAGMKIEETVKISLRNLKSNKMRSVLTMLGIIIGVGAFISMLSIGEGAKQKIVKEIEALGTNMLLVEPSDSDEDKSRNSTGLRYSDYLRLREELKLIKDVAPSISLDSHIIYKDKSFKTVVEGTTPSYSEIRNHFAEKGRFLIEMDIKAWERVAVLGENVVSRLFGDENPIGKDILISGQRFIVIGIMKYKPQTLYIKFNDKVFIPVTTAIKYLTGNERLDKIQFRMKDNIDIKDASAEIKERLLRYHNNKEDFVLSTQEQFLSTLTETSRTLKILLGTVAAISLIVGGIGIMNIMLVSVIERTREIGLRIALGATPDDILKQFLMESVTLALIGGLIGTFLGILSSKTTGMLFTIILPGKEVWEAVITPHSIAGVLFFVTIVGVAAGILPAIKASRLDPAEALRYE
jgi:putative ABC transport system permease protein